METYFLYSSQISKIVTILQPTPFIISSDLERITKVILGSVSQNVIKKRQVVAFSWRNQYFCPIAIHCILVDMLSNKCWGKKNGKIYWSTG